jgi:hypothetical protein
MVGDQAMLVMRQGSNEPVQRWLLSQPLVTIGRGGDNDVVLMHREVSRHHAEIRAEGEGFVIADLGSTNGTFVNTQRVTRPTRLRDGDRIDVASRFELTFIDAEATTPITGGHTRSALLIDPAFRSVMIRGRELDPPLSPGQFAFLELLLKETGRVYSRQEIIESVWPDVSADGITDQAIDALVRRLRERLAELDSHQYVVTVRGHGFRLDQP